MNRHSVGNVVCFMVLLGASGAMWSQGKEYVWDRGGANTNWNDAANWSNKTDNVNDSGFPNGAGDIAVQKGTDTNTTIIGNTPGLSLNQDITIGKMLFTRGANENVTVNAGSPAGRIIFDNNGSEARLEYCRTAYPGDGTQLTILVKPNIVLSDDLFVYVCSARTGNALNGVISDADGEAHKLTLQALGITAPASFGYLTLGNTNSYKGGTVIATSGAYGKVIAGSNGAFGSGDVTVQAGGLLQLNNIGTNDDMIANTASLYLMSTGGVYGKLSLSSGVNESVARLYLDGVQQSAGTYGSTNTGTAASYKLDNWFDGSVTGIVTVLHGPSGPSMILSIR